MKRGRARLFRRAVTGGIVVGALIAAGLVVSAGASPSSSNKSYSASISPGSANGGSTANFTVTIKNLASSTQSLGSANATFPAGFTLPQGAVAPANITLTPPGKTWSTTVAGSVVQLRNPGPSNTNALAPGQSVSVTIAQVGTPASCGSYSLTTQAKQANDFSGAPGNDLTRVGPEPSVTVGSGSLDHFVVSSVDNPQTAGTGFTVTATAYDVCGNVKTNYQGGATVTGTLGTSPAPSNKAPTYGLFGNWTGGQANATVTAYKAETGVHVTVADSGKTGNSNNFDVLPGPLDSFTVGPVASPATAGTGFNVAATAYDAYSNVKTNYQGGATVTGTLGTSPAPSNKAPTYGLFGNWTGGQANATVTAYKAETGVHVTVADSGKTGNSNNFDVLPGPLDSFTVGPVASPATAGTGFNVAATAYDAYSNVKTNYQGGATVTGTLGTSPAPSNKAPTYGLFGNWTGGQANATVTAYKAETGVHVTVADSGKTGNSNNFDVLPGPLGSFTWSTQPPASPTAGVAFGAQVTPADAYSNTISSYDGTSFTLCPNDPSLCGLHSSPNGASPSYGSVNWLDGVGTLTGIADFDAETTQLTASDGSVHSPSGSFTVAHGALTNLAFVQQPTETVKSSPISPAPSVVATDTWGNTISGATISLDNLVKLSGTGVFGPPPGSTSATTDATGTATFGNLSITDVGEYQLHATSNGAGATSSAFLIANQINPCHGSCNASGSANNNTTTDASVNGASTGSSLAVSVILNTAPPAGVCGNKTPLGAGSFVNILNLGTLDQPDFTITWTLDKSIVNQFTNRGASQFDICLGAEDLKHPDGNGATPWTTKDGSPAVPVSDPILGVTRFWGVLGDCPKNPTSPCVLSKNKTKAGDEVIKFFKPHYWDAQHFGQ